MNSQDKVKSIRKIAQLLKGTFKEEDYGKVILPMVILRRFDCGNNLEKLLSDGDNLVLNLKDFINGLSKSSVDIFKSFDFEEQIEKMEREDLLYLVIKAFSQVDLRIEIVSKMEMSYIFEELIRSVSENDEIRINYTPHDVIDLIVNILFVQDDDILTKPGITQTLYDCCIGTGEMGNVAQKYLKELNPTAKLELFGEEVDKKSYAICKADMLIKGQEINNIRHGDALSNDNFACQHFNYMMVNPPLGGEWKNIESIIKKEYEEKGFDGRFGAGLPKVNDSQLLFLQHLVSKMRPVGIGESEQGSRIAIIMDAGPMYKGDAGSGESEIRRFVIENDLLEGIVAMPKQLFYNTGIATYIWILSNNKNSLREGKIQLVNAIDFYHKMKKSIGEKSNELCKEGIEQIAKIYGDFKEEENCKIFNNEDFGYRKIIVERPLRLSFKVDENSIKQLYKQTAFINLALSKKKGEAGLLEIKRGKKLQDEIIESVNTIGYKKYKNRPEIAKIVKRVFKERGIVISGAIFKDILSVLSEKDETADICVDSKGYSEGDTDLRDTENIPLKEDIDEYFEREIRPHVPDAWIDESKRMIGYEISFTRQFYKPTKLRNSKEIMLEIKELEKRILGDLEKVMQ